MADGEPSGDEPDHDWVEYDDTVTEGSPTIYTGGEYASSLLVPTVPQG